MCFVDASAREGPGARWPRRAVLRRSRRYCERANRNSLNQVLARKLGYVKFVTNYQHFREFAFAEAVALSQRQDCRWCRPREFSYSRIGVPGIDEVVRRIQDNDKNSLSWCASSVNASVRSTPIRRCSLRRSPAESGRRRNHIVSHPGKGVGKQPFRVRRRARAIRASADPGGC
jgi:hypothetical protein